MTDDIHVTIRSDPRLLSALRRLVRAYVATFGYADRLDQIVLAVDEACANAIRHSYGGQPDAALSLRMRAGNEVVEIELLDDGVPIPEERAQPPAIEQLDADLLIPGGLGVYLIHRAFDEVVYEPGVHRGNRVLMRLRHPTKQEQEHAVDSGC